MTGSSSSHIQPQQQPNPCQALSDLALECLQTARKDLIINLADTSVKQSNNTATAATQAEGIRDTISEQNGVYLSADIKHISDAMLLSGTNGLFDSHQQRKLYKQLTAQQSPAAAATRFYAALSYHEYSETTAKSMQSSTEQQIMAPEAAQCFQRSANAHSAAAALTDVQAVALHPPVAIDALLDQSVWWIWQQRVMGWLGRCDMCGKDLAGIQEQQQDEVILMLDRCQCVYTV